MLIPQLVTDLIAAKERKGTTLESQKTLRSFLTKFAGAFPGPIGGLHAREVEAWLDALDVGPRSWNNYLSFILGLYKFARRQNAFSEGLTSVERIEKRITTTKIETYTPSELIQLLSVVPNKWLPAIVLGAFAGLRPQEICPELSSRKPALQWKEILWHVPEVVVPKDVSKVRHRRSVPLGSAAMAFLAPWRNASGPVVPRMKMHNLTAKWGRLAGVAWKSDGLRHSYASYRFAMIRDEGKLATEMGTSKSVIHEHYLAHKLEGEAKEWFAIRPDDIVAASDDSSHALNSELEALNDARRIARTERRARLGVKPTQGDAAQQILENLGRSATRTELYKEVIRVGSKAISLSSFTAMLSRDKRFCRVGDRKWSLR